MDIAIFSTTCRANTNRYINRQQSYKFFRFKRYFILETASQQDKETTSRDARRCVPFV